MIPRYYTPGQEVHWNQFIQALVPDPLVLKGRKVDITIFVAFTSLDPLVIYTTQGQLEI